MGKRLSGILLQLISLSAYAASDQQLFDYKELGWDTPRTGAETAFSVRFSDSRVFNCYRNGKTVFKFGVGMPVKGLYLDKGKAIESSYAAKYRTPFDWNDKAAYISVHVGIETKSGFKEIYDSIGKPLFDANDSLKYMEVELLNGKKIEFSRFGPIPNFPFDNRQKLKPFFYYQAEGEQRYECGATNQPD